MPESSIRNIAEEIKRRDYSFLSVQLRLGSESPSTMRAPWAKRPRNTTRMAEPLQKSNRYTRS